MGFLSFTASIRGKLYAGIPACLYFDRRSGFNPRGEAFLFGPRWAGSGWLLGHRGFDSADRAGFCLQMTRAGIKMEPSASFIPSRSEGYLGEENSNGNV